MDSAPVRKSTGDALRLLGTLLQEGASVRSPTYHPDVVWALDAHRGGLVGAIRTWRFVRELTDLQAGAYTGRVLIAPRFPIRVHRIQAFVRVGNPPLPLALRNITASLQHFPRIIVAGDENAPESEIEVATTSTVPPAAILARSATLVDFDELASITASAGRVTYSASDILIPAYEPGAVLTPNGLGVAPLVFEWSRVALLTDDDAAVVLVTGTIGWGIP